MSISKSVLKLDKACAPIFVRAAEAEVAPVPPLAIATVPVTLAALPPIFKFATGVVEVTTKGAVPVATVEVNLVPVIPSLAFNVPVIVEFPIKLVVPFTSNLYPLFTKVPPVWIVTLPFPQNLVDSTFIFG